LCWDNLHPKVKEKLVKVLRPLMKKTKAKVAEIKF
jgi:hypothetical protein